MVGERKRDCWVYFVAVVNKEAKRCCRGGIDVCGSCERRVRLGEIAQKLTKDGCKFSWYITCFLIGLTSRTTMVADCPSAKRTSVRRYTSSAWISVPLRP